MPNGKVIVETEIEVKDKVETLRPHVVIVWDDNEHSIEFVIDVLMEVCKMSKDEAIKTTIEIYQEGKAVVWRSHKELAELKRDQIATFRDARLQQLINAPNVPLNVTVGVG